LNECAAKILLKMIEL